MPAPRSVSPWWALVLIPLALGAGQLIGSVPVASNPGPAASGARTPASASSIAGQAPAEAFRPSGGPDTPDGIAAPAGDAGVAGAASPASPVPRPETPHETSAGPIRWWSLADAMDESRRTGKPVLIDFNAAWCGPCRAMKREVFETSRVAGRIAAVVIPVSIVDRAREDGRNPADIEDLQRRYEVDAFPTLVVFSPATGKMVRDQGYGGAEGTESWITQAAAYVR